MSRQSARAVGQYFATPQHLVARLAALVSVRWAPASRFDRIAVVDPCAGDGAAVVAACRVWAPPEGLGAGLVRLYAAELEKGRARALADRARVAVAKTGWTLHGDGLRVATEGDAGWGQKGASVLWLNPPYDDDPVCGRTEERFLRAWAPRVAVGGALVFLMPHASLAASADTLARYFGELVCFRFPADDFDAYKQVALVAVRRAEITRPDGAIRLQCQLWARDVSTVPELPADPRPVVRVTPSQYEGFTGWRAAPVDLAVVRAEYEPWASTSKGVVSPMHGILPEPSAMLLGATYPVAMPPRPSHIAAALAAGVYSGAEVVPDDASSGLPRALIKATFDRAWLTREEKHNRDGEKVGEIQVQAPQLRLVALDLDTYRYHPLRAEVEASGSTTLSDFTAGDLLARYGRSLLGVLRARCPVLHDPQDPAHARALAPIARPLYRAQHAAAVAGVRLLEGDRGMPLLLGQIGSGKSSVVQQMAAERGARSQLILCPPHLLSSWATQLRAVLGGVVPYAVHPIESLDDVEAYARWRADEKNDGVMGVALLSREKAKLGHAWRSVVTSNCPACGAPLGPEKSAGERARRRLTCEAKPNTPHGALARAVEALAVGLAPAWGDDPAVQSVLSRPLLAHLETVWPVRRADPKRIKRLVAKTAAHPSVAAAARTVLDLIATTPLHHETERVLHDAVYRLAAGAGDDTLALDLAEQAAHYRARDPHDHTAANATARARLIAFGLLACVRDPALRARRDAARVALVEADPAGWGSVRAPFEAKLRRMSGDLPPAVAGQTWDYDRWPLVSRSDGGGVLVGKVAWGDARVLPDVLRELAACARWVEGPECGAPLYQPEGEVGGGYAALDAVALGRPVPVAPESAAAPVKGLRRVPIATYIARRHRGLFDFLVADEAHELSSEESAQGRASTRLQAGVRDVVCLTGSSSNGYASSLFTMLWNASPAFRAEFPRAAQGLFVERYGFRKRLVQKVDREGKVVSFGSHSDRVTLRYKDVGEAPGVLPLLVLRHVLPLAVTIQKADLALDLPPHTESVVWVPPGEALARTHLAFVARVVEQVKKDTFTPLAGKLLGALARSPTQADRCTEDTGNWKDVEHPVAPSPISVENAGCPSGRIPDGAYVVDYPESAGTYAGQLVAVAEPFARGDLMPKEAALLAEVERELAEGRRVMVHAWHDDVCARLHRLLEARLGEKVARLEASKVTPSRREAWINDVVIAKGRRVMVVNPVAVKTGLNNLVWFHTSIWFENPGCNPEVYDQASGRIDRIGKTLPSRSIFLVYDLPTQRSLHRLLMHKAGVLRATDGLDPEQSLALAGASEDLAFAGMGLGRELYALLTGE